MNWETNDSQELLRNAIQQQLKNKTAKEFCDEIKLNQAALSAFLNHKRTFRKKAANKYFKQLVSKEQWEKISEELIREETGSKNIRQ